MIKINLIHFQGSGMLTWFLSGDQGNLDYNFYILQLIFQ